MGENGLIGSDTKGFNAVQIVTISAPRFQRNHPLHLPKTRYINMKNACACSWPCPLIKRHHDKKDST
jgi:hypothetical protein